ncbi:large subunit ribosomal protein L31 [Candidatus Xenohaliotis californiensis]|uniref:Large ribosomal subunit protein bL31 n=1 Tax=Candidatus Xenohaliotis californiensis TaxID=84677 RepID=A0ABP0EWV5_9RICK|nr:large subunit ribosomal protein L31 [Candidatus Xenohaliotis californiensis]
MKKNNKHPKAGELVVTCTNGMKFTTISTKPGQIKLDADPFNHMAWNAGVRVSDSPTSKSTQFTQKLGKGGNFFNEDILK